MTFKYKLIDPLILVLLVIQVLSFGYLVGWRTILSRPEELLRGQICFFLLFLPSLVSLGVALNVLMVNDSRSFWRWLIAICQCVVSCFVTVCIVAVIQDERLPEEINTPTLVLIPPTIWVVVLWSLAIGILFWRRRG